MARSKEHGDKYEGLVRVLAELPPATAGDRRTVHWAGANKVIGLSRDLLGRIEIFIAGPELRCTSRVIGANLAYDRWERTQGGEFQANRLRLPAEPQYDAIAAFLCTYLLDNRADDDPQAGFTRSEPVLEIAFERSRVQGEALIGLCGELLVLRALLDRRPERAEEIFQSWEGYGPSARDFHLQTVGLEIKTTRGPQSRHHIQGTRQVEMGHGKDGFPETALYLVSIGVEASEDDDTGQAWSLPGLIDSILDRAEDALASTAAAATLSDRFLGHVREYGSGFGEGYDHREMRHHVLFGTRFRTTFVRAYDMADSAITVLRKHDLLSYAMVAPESVEYEVVLPDVVHGDVNPVTGLTQATKMIAHKAWD